MAQKSHSTSFKAGSRRSLADRELAAANSAGVEHQLRQSAASPVSQSTEHRPIPASFRPAATAAASGPGAQIGAYSGV